MKIKKELYQENKVPEYWIIDPIHETVFIYLLESEETYSPPKVCFHDETISSALFPNFQLDLKEVFEKKF